MATPLISCRNLTRVLPGEVPVTLVNDITLAIAPGEMVAITGASGSGKSSLLYLLGLLDAPTGGEVCVNGEVTVGLSSAEKSALRLRQFGFVFQFHFLLPEFTVLDNVTLPMQKLGLIPAGEQRDKALGILNELGVGERPDKRPSQLSGGQRQRVAIARALANDPQVILADEPTGNLDTKNASLVFDIFRRITDTQGRSVVVVTHEESLAARCHRRLHLVDGKLV